MPRTMPWHAEYEVFGIPKTLAPYPEKPVSDICDLAAGRFTNTGLIQGGFFLPYPKLKEQVDRLATALAAMGMKKGDRVATLLPTSIAFVVADYAIAKAGCVHIPSSSLEPASNLEHKFNTGSPKAIICLDEYLEKALDAAKATGIQFVIVSRLADYSNFPPALFAPKPAPEALWMADLIAAFPAAPPAITFDAKKDLETLLFTGGTTGLPKGCMLTHFGTYANAVQNQFVMGATGKLVEGAISVLLGVPFFHSYGHVVMHTMTLMGLNQILIPDSRDTDAMVDAISTYKPVMQIGVPTQFMKISSDKLKGAGILGMSGSAPLPPTAQKDFEEKSGGGIMEGYGLSEMGPVTHLNTSFLLRITGGRNATRINNKVLTTPGVIPVLNTAIRAVGPKVVGAVATKGLSLLVKASKKNVSSGQSEKRGTAGIPYPDTEVKLLDVNTGKPLTVEEMASGMRGEMCLRGPQRMAGYWPEPGSGMDEEGFVHTGDVVMVDPQGYFYIVDRTKDMIIVSGYKVYSREVDDLLFAHPGVELAATIGIPDAEREGSERVAVFVQPKPEWKDKLTAEEIISYLQNHVAKYAVPKVVQIVDAIPQTEVHKTDKKALRALAASQLLNK
ncbi:MAG: AMP-binding protein [Desulfatibacillaceae bacterium]|nr:AMP-binding protein [Desulfatibacillaceae bacterium]